LSGSVSPENKPSKMMYHTAVTPREGGKYPLAKNKCLSSGIGRIVPICGTGNCTHRKQSTHSYLKMWLGWWSFGKKLKFRVLPFTDEARQKPKLITADNSTVGFVLFSFAEAKHSIPQVHEHFSQLFSPFFHHSYRLSFHEFKVHLSLLTGTSSLGPGLFLR